jgi:hypothetical protein
MGTASSFQVDWPFSLQLTQAGVILHLRSIKGAWLRDVPRALLPEGTWLLSSPGKPLALLWSMPYQNLYLGRCQGEAVRGTAHGSQGHREGSFHGAPQGAVTVPHRLTPLPRLALHCLSMVRET